jgi:hypothetical protein
MDQASLERTMALIHSIDYRRTKPLPLTLDDTTRALYQRAIADPSSLSEEERRKILQKPPREEEGSLCYDICGFTMSELIAKAIQDPDSLSYQEMDLIIKGVSSEKYKDMLDETARLVPADMDLWFEASNVAKTKDELAAVKVCWAKRSAIHDARQAAREALGSSDHFIIKRALIYTPWQDHIMSSSASTKTLAPCGFVVFYPKDQASNWFTFKEQMEKFVSHGFHRCSSLLKEPIMRGFELHDIPHDSSESLQSHFVAMRDAGDIPTGLRHDTFLYVDNEAFQSLDSDRPFVWLWEPQEQLEPQKQLGPVKIDIRHVAPLLLMRLTQRDMSLEKRQLEMWRCMPDLEGLHGAAGLSTNESREEDGIWPPRTLAMAEATRIVKDYFTTARGPSASAYMSV